MKILMCPICKTKFETKPDAKEHFKQTKHSGDYNGKWAYKRKKRIIEGCDKEDCILFMKGDGV